VHLGPQCSQCLVHEMARTTGLDRLRLFLQILPVLAGSKNGRPDFKVSRACWPSGVLPATVGSEKYQRMLDKE
jgi:hypothetical protein